MTEPVIQIGASEKAIDKARATVFEILRFRCSDDLKSQALETLRSICETHAVIENCTFNGEEKARRGK